MFRVTNLIKQKDINCIQLKSSKSKYVKVISGNKNGYFKVEINPLIKEGEIGMNQLSRNFFNLTLDSNVMVIFIDKLEEYIQNVSLEISVVGNNNPSLKEVHEDFRFFSEQLADIPLFNGLHYLFKCTNINYLFKCTNIYSEYAFVSGITIKYNQKQKSQDDNLLSNLSKLNCCEPEANYKLKRRKEETVTKPHSDDDFFNGDFNFDELGIGGLDEQFKKIFRVAFASRILTTESESMGVKPPKGILLYGPPGTGKTLIARKMAQILNAKSFQLVNGPELINKFVGQSAENARNLFKEAEEDSRNGVPGLHVIIFDEFDAIGKRRSSNESGSSSITNDVVNQLLSKIEGVEELNNILIIAMTNLKETLDPALLRSGRIELHIEIGLPDKEGRRKIFEIHTKDIRKNGHIDLYVDFDKLADITTNFTGAEIKSAIGKASTYPLTKLIDPKTMKKISNEKPIVTMQDFILSIEETIPVMGSVNKEIDLITSKELDLSNDHFREVYEGLINCINDYFLNGNSRSLCRNFTILISGETFSGKTKLVAHAVSEMIKTFSHIKFITPEKYLNEDIKIWNSFQEGKRSNNFLFVIDSIETIFDYSIGGIIPSKTRELLSIISSNVENEKKIVTILTCSDVNMIRSLNLDKKVTIHYEL